jgi:hypothetical protein
MNKILPENIIYVKNDKTENQLFKIQIYENYTKISLIKKYFCKFEKEKFTKIYDYKPNDDQLRMIISDYCFHLFIEKPKYIKKVLRKGEKFIFIVFVLGIILILI